MQTIKLNNRAWEIDTKNSLGVAGGFGEVFHGKCENGDVAIKRLKVTAAESAHRELLIGKSLSERSLKNIVPILDYGQDAESDRYFIVMPICDRSLQDEISNGGKFSSDEIINILISIMSGLAEVPDITHRDLKPANILLHESMWKIADFGIAKFVEDSTSLETLRSSLTPLYAAPEQWLLQKPTSSTDIYATGCIGHALATGNPPFSGDLESLRKQHLEDIPKLLTDLPTRVRSLISLMLRKVPDTRPRLERCVDVFQKELESASNINNDVGVKIAEAVSELAVAQAKEETKERQRLETKHNRDLIFNEAAHDLNRIKNRLFDEIKNFAKDVMDKSCSDERLSIGKAVLKFYSEKDRNNIRGLQVNNIISNHWGVHKKKSEWDIIAYTTISIEQRVAHEVCNRCANLVFGRLNEKSEYRWYEISFWSLANDEKKIPPFCLDYMWDIDEALSSTPGIYQLAHPPKLIDGEDEDLFIEYWMDILTEAMGGKYQLPSRIPFPR